MSLTLHVLDAAQNAAALLPAAPAPEPGAGEGGGGGGGNSVFDSANIKALLFLIFGFVLMYLGIVMGGKSTDGKLKNQFERFGAGLLALIMFALGASAALMAYGDNIVNFIF